MTDPTESTRQIRIDFPTPVHVSPEAHRQIVSAVDLVCIDWERRHPGRVMWLFGGGALMTCNPMMLSDDEPIPFDDTVEHIDVAEREAHDNELKRLGRPRNGRQPRTLTDLVTQAEWELKAADRSTAGLRAALMFDLIDATRHLLRRRDELLETTNRYLARARTAEQALTEARGAPRTAFADPGLSDAATDDGDTPDVEIGTAVDHCIRVDQLTRDLMAAEIETGMAAGLDVDQAFTGVSGGVMGALLALTWRNRTPGVTIAQLADHLRDGMHGVLTVIATEEGEP